jgi:hypothetical protein
MSKIFTNQRARYLDYLADFEIDLMWKPGSEQKLSDFLSRFRPCESGGYSICKQCRPKPGARGVVPRNLIDCDVCITAVAQWVSCASRRRPFEGNGRFVTSDRRGYSNRETSVTSINSDAFVDDSSQGGVSTDGNRMQCRHSAAASRDASPETPDDSR